MDLGAVLVSDASMSAHEVVLVSPIGSLKTTGGGGGGGRRSGGRDSEHLMDDQSLYVCPLASQKLITVKGSPL